MGLIKASRRVTESRPATVRGHPGVAGQTPSVRSVYTRHRVGSLGNCRLIAQSDESSCTECPVAKGCATRCHTMLQKQVVLRKVWHHFSALRLLPLHILEMFRHEC